MTKLIEKLEQNIYNMRINSAVTKVIHISTSYSFNQIKGRKERKSLLK